MKNIIFLISVAFLVFSCENTSEEKDQEAINDFSTTFGEANHVFPQLSTSVKEQADKWGILEDFLSEAKNLNGSSFENLQNISERLQQFSDSLIKSVPEAFNTQPINSRLIVLKTRTDLLHQTSHQGIVDSASLQNSVSEMNSAVDNLIIHLNEKFQKEKIDSQRKGDEEIELKKQQRFKDSIMNLELQDKDRKKV